MCVCLQSLSAPSGRAAVILEASRPSRPHLKVKL